MSALWDKCRSMRGVMPSGPGDDRDLRVFSFRLSSYTFVFCKGEGRQQCFVSMSVRVGVL